jgi:hypothetical protein
MTNADKIFQAVIKEPELEEFGHYNFEDYYNVGVIDAINDENVVVATVARIVQHSTTHSGKGEIYNSISNYLKQNVIL